MKAVLSNENLVCPGGSETYVLTVARELERLGHEVCVYAPERGEMADLGLRQGLQVVSGDRLPESCDVTLSADAATCFELAERFPDAARIFVCHSEDYALDYPPQVSEAAHAVVVLNDRVRRFVESQAWHSSLVRLRQPIDVGRYAMLAPPRVPARRVLVSTNVVSGRRAELIEQACRDSDLEVRWIGETSEPTVSPELAIAEADIVIGVGRTALEGMAAGRAAYVYGIGGGDGWVTPESYAGLEADGFTGTATATSLDARTLSDDLRAWRPDMGEAGRDLVYAHHRARVHAKELIALARRIHDDGGISRPSDGLPHARELARLVRLEWQTQGRVFVANAERDIVADQLEQERARVAELQQALAAANSQLEHERARVAELGQATSEGWDQLASFRATRRYRWACRLAAPLDALRKLLGRR